MATPKSDHFLSDISARREPKPLKAGFTFSDGFRLGFGFGIGFLLVCLILTALSWGVLLLLHH